MDRASPPNGTSRAKDRALTVLLGSLALLGPMVAYAGVTVLYPDSTVTADVDTSPPIIFQAGTDHTLAQSVGFAGVFTAENNGGSFTLTVNGLSGGTVTIDKLINLTVDPTVSTYKLEIATALSDISPTTFKIRLWTGATAPSTDTDSQVCAYLSLLDTGGTEASGPGCTDDADVQLVYTLPTGQTTESGSVTIRPSSVGFA